MDTNDWHDALTGVHVPVLDGQQNVELEPFGYRILWRTIK
jgi:hypothetical protein